MENQAQVLISPVTSEEIVYRRSPILYDDKTVGFIATYFQLTESRSQEFIEVYFSEENLKNRDMTHHNINSEKYGRIIYQSFGLLSGDETRYVIIRIGDSIYCLKSNRKDHEKDFIKIQKFVFSRLDYSNKKEFKLSVEQALEEAVSKFNFEKKMIKE